MMIMTKCFLNWLIDESVVSHFFSSRDFTGDSHHKSLAYSGTQKHKNQYP